MASFVQKLGQFSARLLIIIFPVSTEQEEDPLHVQFAQKILLLALGAASIFAITFLLLEDYWRSLICITFLVIGIYTYYLAQRQWLLYAMRILTVVGLALLVSGVTFSGGLYGPGFHAVYMILAAVMLLFGRNALIQSSVVVTVWAIVLASLEVFGIWVSPRIPIPSIGHSILIIILLVMNMAFLNFAIQILLNANAKMRRARDEATAANQAKSQFLANMSHELRTPLHAIIGYSQLILNEIERDDADIVENKVDVERIHVAGNHLLSVVNDILDLSKIEANQLDLAYHAVDLPELLNDIVGTVRPLADQNNNRIDVVYSPADIDDQQLPVLLDQKRVRQILLNLADNANKFTVNGTITLTCHHLVENQVNQVCFHVKDTGIGIPEERFEQVFQSFQQVDNSLSRPYEGTGLGLTITKSLVELMSGTIDLTSELGQGTEFKVTLPIHTES